MKILVTGSNGMLGQDLCPTLKNENFTVLATTSQNLDITNAEIVNMYFNDNKPDFVIHAAAYTNVDLAESEQEKAFLINSAGTENIAKACTALNIPILYISTDYVFDGSQITPYQVDDKTNPLNIYGLSKLKGENAVINNCKKYYIARTSWLYGHNGKNFVETMINLALNNSKLKVVEDQKGCPTWTVALADGIVKLIKDNYPYGIYHICGSGSTSWHGFAQEIMRLIDKDIEIQAVTTEEFPRPAKRPMNSIMDNNNICPDWQVSLAEYIKLRSL